MNFILIILVEKKFPIKLNLKVKYVKIATHLNSKIVSQSTQFLKVYKILKHEIMNCKNIKSLVSIRYLVILAAWYLSRDFFPLVFAFINFTATSKNNSHDKNFDLLF